MVFLVRELLVGPWHTSAVHWCKNLSASEYVVLAVLALFSGHRVKSRAFVMARHHHHQTNHRTGPDVTHHFDRIRTNLHNYYVCTLNTRYIGKQVLIIFAL